MNIASFLFVVLSGFILLIRFILLFSFIVRYSDVESTSLVYRRISSLAVHHC